MRTGLFGVWYKFGMKNNSNIESLSHFTKREQNGFIQKSTKIEFFLHFISWVLITYQKMEIKYKKYLAYFYYKKGGKMRVKIFAGS